MKSILRLVSFAGLLLMFVSALKVYRGTMSADTYHVLALAGTGLWFATVPFWMKRRLHQSD